MRAKAMVKRDETDEMMVVARLPRREKRAVKPTRISTMVEMTATM